MIPKELKDIILKDLHDLVDNKVMEWKTIEYKSALPGRADKDKREFLGDVSSFANAGGGDIIYGISEDTATGEPKEVTGLEVQNMDAEIRRLEDSIRDGISPRLSTVHFSQPVPVKDGRIAFVIRIGRSWNSPHRVTFSGYDKFFSRGTNKKYPLDVAELRTAFTMSETIVERVRKFREERIARLYANETPVPMKTGAKMVLHVMPLSSFGQKQNLDIACARTSPSMRAEPIRSAGYNGTFTLEGFVTYSSQDRFGQSGSYSYGHLYRNGIIEYVEMSMLADERSKIQSILVERQVVEALRKSATLLSSAEVPPPYFVFLSLIGVKGYSLDVPRESHIYTDANPHPLDSEVLSLPEAVIEEAGDDIGKALKLTFDTLWNAFGYAESKSYENGVWVWGDKPL